MRLFEIEPYELFTIEECDGAIAHVVQECADIEEQLEFPNEDQTIGWVRRAKTSLAIGKGLKQRLQMRRSDIAIEIRHERNKRLDRLISDICKEVLPKEQFIDICNKAKQRLMELES